MACSLSRSFLGRSYSALSCKGKGVGPILTPLEGYHGRPGRAALAERSLEADAGQELVLPPRLGVGEAAERLAEGRQRRAIGVVAVDAVVAHHVLVVGHVEDLPPQAEGGEADGEIPLQEEGELVEVVAAAGVAADHVTVDHRSVG